MPSAAVSSKACSACLPFFTFGHSSAPAESMPLDKPPHRLSASDRSRAVIVPPPPEFVTSAASKCTLYPPSTCSIRGARRSRLNPAKVPFSETSLSTSLWSRAAGVLGSRKEDVSSPRLEVYFAGGSVMLVL